MAVHNNRRHYLHENFVLQYIVFNITNLKKIPIYSKSSALTVCLHCRRRTFFFKKVSNGELIIHFSVQSPNFFKSSFFKIYFL